MTMAITYLHNSRHTPRYTIPDMTMARAYRWGFSAGLLSTDEKNPFKTWPDKLYCDCWLAGNLDGMERRRKDNITITIPHKGYRD